MLLRNIILRNSTNFIAQYIIQKGQQIIARLPGLAPNAQMTVPIAVNFEVTATSVIDGNTYTSAPMDVQSGRGFLAQALQIPAQGTYTFEIQKVPSRLPNILEFQKTCLGPVTFTLSKDGSPLQNVVVHDSFVAETLDTGDTFYVYAVINGVTTKTETFSNPSAIITAVTANTDLENGYFTLMIN